MRTPNYEATIDRNDAVVREMLLHRVHELPYMQDLMADAPVICSQCGAFGETVEDVLHQTGCTYEEPTCMCIPY